MPYGMGAVGSMGRNDFLQLLVTQLKYQNPMEPINDHDFVAQLAQFSSLEELTSISELMQLQMELNSFAALASMVGKTITYGEGSETVTGVVEKVNLGEGGATLVVNGKEIRLGDVKSIS